MTDSFRSMPSTLHPVVVTGASTGIGAACARALGRRGYPVFAGVRRPEDGERLVSGADGNLRWILLDVTDHASVLTAVSAVQQGLGGSPGIGGLVNNAGVAVAAPLETIDLDAFKAQFEVNVFGLLRTTQAFFPLLRSGGGRIVNVGSIAGRVVSPMLGAYSASKFAVEAMSDALRLEVGREGIEVSVIEPGVVFTPIWEKSMAVADDLVMRMSPEAQARYDRFIRALRRVVTHPKRPGVTPEVVADAVIHAVTARRPKTRYLVGRDAKIRNLLRLLPDRWHDRLIQSMLDRIAARASSR